MPSDFAYASYNILLEFTTKSPQQISSHEATFCLMYFMYGVGYRKTNVPNTTLLLKTNTNSVASIRERGILSARPPLIGEVSDNFCG
jgi:hypothetical protein